MSWVKMTEAPHRCPGLNYRALYQAALDGKIRSERRGAAWWLWEPDVQLFAIEKAGVANGVTVPELDAMRASFAPLRATTQEISRAMIAEAIGFRSLEADYREAVDQGNLTLADAIRETITFLKAGQVTWNDAEGRWILEVPGVGRASTQATVTPPARAKESA